MHKSLISKIFVLLLVVGLLFAVAPTKQAQAGTLDVCPTCTYTTINDAITAANPGDIINVGSGTYNENLYITKALTLRGPNAGVSAGVTPGTRGPEAVIRSLSNFYSIYIPSDNVTIDGFTIDGSGMPTPSAYVLGTYGSGNNYIVQNNVFIGFEAGIPVYSAGGTASGYRTGIIVKDNSMVNATLGTSGYNFGMWLQSSISTVSDNVVSNFRNGIWVQSYTAPGAATVSGNIFNVYDIGIWFDQSKDATANWSFVGNKITGIAYPGGLTPDRFNAISVSNFDAGNVDFEGNSILVGTSNVPSPLQYSEANVASGTRDAAGNWWGSAAGPATGAIVGTINYTPWCLDEACTPPPVLCTTDCYVDATLGNDTNLGNPTTPFKTIQKGIDSATAGGTVNVAAGTYNEQIEITKDLKLVGAGIDASIIKAPATLPVASDARSAIVLVHGTGVDSEISGFSISGPGPSGCGSIRAGVYVYDSAYLNLHDNKLVDIRDSGATISGCQNGVAILVGRNALATSGTATIKDNIIVNYQKGAIVVDNTGSNAVITNNTITGAGTTSITAQNAIQISRGATATISGNTVSGNSYYKEGDTTYNYAGTGVLLYNAGDVAFTDGNNFTGNDSHVYISGAGTVTMGAETFGALSAPVGSGYFVINYNDVPLDLTQATFPTTDPFVKANRIWDGIDEAGLGLARFEAGHLYVNVGGSIQRAVNLSTQGDTIHIEAGHYDENVTTTTAMNKTVKLIGQVNSSGAPASTLHGKLELNNSLMNEGNLIENIRFEQLSILNTPYPTGKTVHDSLYLIQINGITIRNCHFVGSDLDTVGRAIEMDGASNGTDDVLIENCLFTGPYNIGIDRAVQDITVRNTTFDGVRSGMNLQTGGTNLVVENSTFRITALTAANNAFGIRVGTLNTVGSAKQITITDSTFEINKNGLTPNAGVYHEAIVVRFADGVPSQVHNSSIVGGGLVNLASGYTVDATGNWWGSPCGPSTIVGPVVVSPWWADVAMTIEKTSVPTGDFTVTPSMGVPSINASIACALPNTTVTFDPGDYTGTIILPPGRDYLTLKLKDGVNLKPNSPCITVGSSYTWITTESIGGATCIPSSGSNGIDVAANLVNIEISGLEIDGTGQTTGDGIHVAGALVDTVIVDNNIHDLGGDGIEFVGDVTGVTDIQGNMFKNNTGYGINYGGTATLGVEYNSWGNYAGPTAGDGANGPLTTTPFTHADLYLVSSGTPWANQVVKGNNITYTVMAHLNQVNAADFVLTYPAELTYVSSTKSGSLGTFETLTHNATAGTLQFIGVSTSGNKSGDLPLFTVTFTGATAGVNKPLAFSYTTTSGFGMVGYESSSNVYVNEMVDSTVTIVDLPTISSTDIQGYYLSGEQRQFSVVLDNPLTGADYQHVYVDFTIANAQVAQFGTVEYSVDGGTTWVALGTGPGTSIADSGTDIVGYFGKVTGGGFPMAAGASLPTLFRVTFPVREQGATDFPTSYAVTMQLRDADSTPAGLLLDDFSDMMYVYDKPTVTVATTDQYLIVGEPGAFTVTINNPTTGRNYNDTVVFDVLIPSHAVSDFSALSCSISSPVAFTWNLLPLLVSDGAGGVKARIVGLDGYFEVPPTGLDMVLTCSVTVTTPGAYSASGNMVDVVSKVAPIVERVVSSNVSLSTTAYTKPTMTAAFPTGPYAAGVPVTVPVTITNPDGIPAPFELVFDLPAGTVINYGGTDYVCTTTCPPIVVTLPLTAADFIITFDEAWTGTAGLSLYDSDWTPSDRLLATASQTGVVVNAGFSFSGTVSMQGNASRAGVPVTFEWGGTLVVYGPTFNTTNAISNNLTGVLTYGGSYTVITNQARYLNIGNLPTDTYGITKTITNVSANLLLNTLQLKAGNAVYTDNIVNDQDSGMVASGYINGIGGTFADADVNFDGRANIQDLALVGGNYFLTSATAYSSWSPVTP